MISHLICWSTLPCSHMACINFTKTHHWCPSLTSLCASSSHHHIREPHIDMCSACSPIMSTAHPTARGSPSLGMLSGIQNAGFVNVNGKGVSFRDHFSVYGSVFGSLGDDILLAIVAQSVADLYHPLTGILFGFGRERKTPAL
jgi:hypothetical protein